MRLGGPVFGECGDPERWIAAVREQGYRAAYCPLDSSAADDTVRAFATAAKAADVVIAEVGAWSNPLSPNEDERHAALEKCCAQLDLAERIGARCCVNIAGSCGTQWDGPDPVNFSAETFERIVETVRAILDTVQPRRSFYTLETMPWAYPDSADNYHLLLHAIDRAQFAVHLDPVNLICSPQRYFANGALLKECFKKLGPYIKSCHAKDIRLSGQLTVHLEEVRPGEGALDYRTYLRALSELDADTPLMLEHLPNAAEYSLAARHIRAVAAEEAIAL